MGKSITSTHCPACVCAGFQGVAPSSTPRGGPPLHGMEDAHSGKPFLCQLRQLPPLGGICILALHSGHHGPAGDLNPTGLTLKSQALAPSQAV